MATSVAEAEGGSDGSSGPSVAAISWSSAETSPPESRASARSVINVLARAANSAGVAVGAPSASSCRDPKAADKWSRTAPGCSGTGGEPLLEPASTTASTKIEAAAAPWNLSTHRR
jgi:hypothetical protein